MSTKVRARLGEAGLSSLRESDGPLTVSLVMSSSTWRLLTLIVLLLSQLSMESEASNVIIVVKLSRQNDSARRQVSERSQKPTDFVPSKRKGRFAKKKSLAS